MGPCPTKHLLLCPLTDSFNQWMWLDPELILPTLGGEPDTITISGWSGGSVTANNLVVAYSDYIKGAGLIEGYTYGAQPFIDSAEESADKNIALANELAEQGRIDASSNLDDKPIFIFSALDDSINAAQHQQYQKDFFDYYKSNVEFVTMDGIDHTLPSIFEQSEVKSPKNGAQ